MPAQFRTSDPAGFANRGMQMATEGASRIGASTETTTTRDGGGVNVAQAAIGLAQAGVGIYAQLKAFKTEKLADFYQKQMEADPNWKPDFQSEDTDMKALNIARLRAMDVRKEDAAYKRDLMQTRKMEYDLKHQTLQNDFQEGNALWKTDRAGALKKFEKAYESLNDGNDITFGDDHMSYTIKGPDGKALEPVRFASTEALKAHLDDIYKQVATPQDYAKTAMAVRDSIVAENTRVALNPINCVDKSGHRGTMYKGFRDPNTGYATPNKYEIDGQEVPESEWKKMGMTETKEAVAEQDLENKKAGAGLIKAQTAQAGAQAAHATAETGKTQAETKRLTAEAENPPVDLKNAAPEIKLAAGVSQALGMPYPEAVKWVIAREDQKASIDTKLQIAAALLKQNGGDTTDKDFVKAVQAMGIEDLVGAEQAPGKGAVPPGSSKEGAGVRGAVPAKAGAASAKSGAGATKPAGQGEKKQVTEAEVLDALGRQFPDAPDGTRKSLGKVTFEKKNGVWKRT